MSDAPLMLRGVVKRFADVVAVAGVDLDLEPGEILALVGPSGCGKSSLLRSIAGLLAIDEGTIRIDGELVDDGHHRLPPERRPAGLVFQEHALFPHLTVAENIAFGLRGMATAEREARVDEMLALVSLPSHTDRYPHELSGGERQRVALARALAPAPSLMLFDEPFASLDQNLRIQLRQDVAEALRATGTPAVFVTHDQGEALAIADRIAVMHQGRIVQVGSPAEVYHRPADRFVGAFMGEASFLPIDPWGTTVLGPTGSVEHAADSVAMVRPDDVVFTPGDAGDAEVVDVEYLGSGWLLGVDIGGQHVRCAVSHLWAPSLGDRGSLSLTPGHRQVLVADRGGPQAATDAS